jgi:murein L,D-transpeptidase YcbB/YkuD
MTAWVDEQGVVNFRSDVYRRDRKVAIPAGLAAPTIVAQQQHDLRPAIRRGSGK